jgi:DNA-binding NarL/FixJ family response regulator
MNVNAGTDASRPFRDETDAACTRLVLVSDVVLYREGLAALLGRIDWLRVVASLPGPEEAASSVRDDAADVVLLDLGSRSVDAARKLLAAAPEARVVVLAAPEAADEVIALAEEGVLGYVTREESLEGLGAAIESAARDETACSPWIATLLVRRVQALAAGRPAATDPLTAREATVLELIAKGLSNREIGSRLHIELSTVKNHVHDILRKLGAHTRAEAVALSGRAPPGVPRTREA